MPCVMPIHVGRRNFSYYILLYCYALNVCWIIRTWATNSPNKLRITARSHWSVCFVLISCITALTTQSWHNSRRSQSVRLVRWSFEGFEENPTSVYLYRGGYLSLFVLQVCSQSELRKLFCIKMWNGMNLTSMQIFRSVILITGYVTLKPRQLNFNDTFHLTFSNSSKRKVSNCSANKSRLACVISILVSVKRRLQTADQV